MTTPTPGVTHPPVLESAVPTAAATATLAPTPSAASFTTTGSSAAWTGLNWSAIPDTSPIRTPMTGFLQWSGGYVATAAPRQNEPTPAMWTSPDGQTWTQAPIRSAFVSAAPGGLLAIAVDPSGPYRPGVVWTSSDGTTWHDGGQSNLPGSLVSLAGTNAGLVATVDSTTDNTLTYSVFFSPDGIHWTAQGPTIQPINGQIPHVQSGSGRFFLMGMSGPLSDSLTKPRFVLDASTIKDRTLWSDDGRTWTECAGTYSGFAKTVLFGRDGLLLETNFNSTPGGSGMARSADGGKTWIPDDQFNPLGVADTSQQAGSIGPAGVIVSNGVAFLAVSDGAKASISYDGESWSPISWDGSAPTDFRIGNWAGFLMLPHGVIVGDAYGAAR
jgi:hypothetical protein